MHICEVLAGTVDARNKKADMDAINQYLYDKWIAPSDKCSYQSLSVAAGGSISLAGDLTLPAGAAIAVGTDADGKIGKIAVSGAVTLADTGTITVTVPAGVKPAAGVYPILTAGTPDASAAEKLKNWTAVFPTVKGRTFALKVVDGQICLEVGKLGLFIVVQ